MIKVILTSGEEIVTLPSNLNDKGLTITKKINDEEIEETLIPAHRINKVITIKKTSKPNVNLANETSELSEVGDFASLNK